MGQIGLIDGRCGRASGAAAVGRRQQQAGSPGQGPAPAQAGLPTPRCGQARRHHAPERPLARASPAVCRRRASDNQPPSPATASSSATRGGHDALEAIAGSDRYRPLAGPAWQSGKGVAASAAPRPTIRPGGASRGSRGVRQASIHCSDEMNSSSAREGVTSSGLTGSTGLPCCWRRSTSRLRKPSRWPPARAAARTPRRPRCRRRSPRRKSPWRDIARRDPAGYAVALERLADLAGRCGIFRSMADEGGVDQGASSAPAAADYRDLQINHGRSEGAWTAFLAAPAAFRSPRFSAAAETRAGNPGRALCASRRSGLGTTALTGSVVECRRRPAPMASAAAACRG